MAKQSNNVVTHGLSGKIGDLLVFSQRAGKTVVSKVPHRTAAATEKQMAHRRRFQQATIYGRTVQADPQLKELYGQAAKKGQTAYNIAVADMLQAPDIERIDLSGYTGQPGDTIRIQVTDDFSVKEVKVTITNADGSLVEEGAATPDAIGYQWKYTATSANDDLDGDRIVITASDMPGNISKEEQTL